MTDNDFLMADYLVQLEVLHELNELKRILHEAGIRTKDELVSALKISKVKPRIMTLEALAREKERNK